MFEKMNYLQVIFCVTVVQCGLTQQVDPKCLDCIGMVSDKQIHTAIPVIFFRQNTKHGAFETFPEHKIMACSAKKSFLL